MEEALRAKFRTAQANHTLHHPTLPQPTSFSSSSSSSTTTAPDDDSGDKNHERHHMHVLESEHCFVICADTQLGMTNENASWETEMENSRKAIAAINAMDPRPAFCCICGDLVHMTSVTYKGRKKQVSSDASSNDAQGEESATWTEKECDNVQDAQIRDFQSIWGTMLHPSIALVCLCGNHDVGDRPTAASIQRYEQAFGNDHLTFWVNGTYNIVVNTSLFFDPTDAPDLHQQQLDFLQHRLQYAQEHKARNIFVFGHHPWFLYTETEAAQDVTSVTSLPPSWTPPSGGETPDVKIPDAYFHIPLQHRKPVMDLFEKFNVSACFAGHFHQNLISKASFGMQMITTGPLSVVLESNGIPDDLQESKTIGFRVVKVKADMEKEGPGTLDYHFQSV